MFFKKSKYSCYNALPTNDIKSDIADQFCHSKFFDSNYDIMFANYRMLTNLMMDTYKKIDSECYS